MQIHELNNFSGMLGSGTYLAVDDGNDTGKLSTQGLLAATEARIDNIIAGPAPSAQEITDARLGANGVIYPSLGDAIRNQVTDLKSDLNAKMSVVAVENGYSLDFNAPYLWEQGGINQDTGENSPSTSAYYQYNIRTKGFISNLTEVIKCLNLAEYYRFGVYRYASDGTYIDRIAKQSEFYPESGYKYRLALAKYSSATLSNNVTVTVNDYVNMGLFSTPSKIVQSTDIEYDAMTSNYISNRAVEFDYAQDLNSVSQWAQGRIDSAGNDINSGTLHPYRIRTSGYVPEATEKIVSVNGYFWVYIYSNDGTYEGSNGSWVKEYDSFVAGKKYRLIYSLTTTSNAKAVNPSDNWDDVHFLKNPLYSNSPFKKHIAWSGDYSTEWYEGQGSDYSLFNSNSTYADMISAYDALMALSNGYMTKESIGQSSDGQTMYAYKLIPTLYRNITIDDKNRPPMVMVVPCLHGFEKSASFGTYYFVRDLVQNFYGKPALDSMRSKCCFIIIPCANPWGFDNRERKNYNGVDLNRNWGTPTGSDEGGSTNPDSPYYAGAEPFDQPETQAIKSVIDANPNMFYLVDYHTNGQYKAPSWNNVNWLSMVKEATTDNYYVHAYYSAIAHISAITENMLHEYSLDSSGSQLGNITVGTGTSVPTIGHYVKNKGIMGHTFEGNNGFPSESEPYSPQEQKANSELVGNWIKTLLSTFATVK